MEITAEKITRQYFRKSRGSNVFQALKETDLTLEPGRLVEITGRSGSGKSTMLNILSGLLAPTSGKVLYDGTDIYAMGDAERSRFRNQNIGIIPQGQTGLHSLTVLENVLLPCTMYGDEIPEEKAVALLERVGIAELRDTYPNELSGGEMRRLSIARAMLRNPGIILADEPTGDLDDENTHAVLKLLREAADNGAAVLLVTHETEAAAYADKVYVMDGGVLRESEK